jgi:prepilin-type N-terminal cleavage/methylation domain-containing protein
LRQNKGGFTLVELIVAMGISLIVMGIAAAILLSGTSMAQHTTQRALEQQIIDGAFNTVQNRLLYTSMVEKRTGAPSGNLDENAGLFYVSTDVNGASSQERGMLFFRSVPSDSGPATSVNLMGNEFYLGYTISLEATIINSTESKPIMTIKMKLYDKLDSSRVVATRERTITLINGEPAESNATITLASPDLLCFATN